MSQNNISKIRLESYNISNQIWIIGQKYVKHQTIARFFNMFFKPRLDNIILYQATEQELKDVLWSVKQKIDPLFAKMDTLQGLKNTPTDIELTKKLMKLPNFKELEELFD
jgi:hypothetical protein